MDTPRLPLLTVFGLGRLRPAPGTWGSLPPVVLAGALIAIGIAPGSGVFEGVMIAVMLFFSAACVAQGDLAESVFGKKDHGNIVADETAGQCVTLVFLSFLPADALATPLAAAFTLWLCFIAFRAMDIVKPWPADATQKFPAGWGVLVDDLFAGFYGFLIVLGASLIVL
ncbi:MAG: phosphatidylglycerophosphatase A [Planctomycetota bacterium]